MTKTVVLIIINHSRCTSLVVIVVGSSGVEAFVQLVDVSLERRSRSHELCLVRLGLLACSHSAGPGKPGKTFSEADQSPGATEVDVGEAPPTEGNMQNRELCPPLLTRPTPLTRV